MKKYSTDFGSKEFLLNYANRRWGLTKTSKVGEVMALIRECQPQTYDEWQKWYFENAYTKTKTPHKITVQTLKELGERLYIKLFEIVIPEIKNVVDTLTYDDCLDYIFNLTINRTYDGFLTEKSLINDNLSKRFKEVIFDESDPRLDHAGDIDYIGRVDKNAFGLQIKPVTANANLGNYDVSARMQQSFRDFEAQFKGKVFIVFSVAGRVINEDVYAKIAEEIERLKHLSS